LNYRKENNKPDLSEQFKIQKLNKIDLNLFEKKPSKFFNLICLPINNTTTLLKLVETNKTQHVFIKPVGIPPQSVQSNDSFSQSKSFNGSNIANEIKFNQVKPTENLSQSQKASAFKQNSMQSYKSSSSNGYVYLFSVFGFLLFSSTNY